MDLDAFEQFLIQHEKDIFSFCRHLTLDRHWAEELYQETVLKAFEMMDRIHFTRNPKALLFSIAVGKWKNTRRKRVRAAIPLTLSEGMAEDNGETPERYAERRQLQDCLGAALAAMDDRFRIPLLLHYFDGSSVEAIAAICGIPQGTVKSRLFKGRVLLRDALIKEGFSDV